jgi:hypothetical protein
MKEELGVKLKNVFLLPRYDYGIFLTDLIEGEMSLEVNDIHHLI